MHPLTDAFIQGRAKFKKKEIGSYFNSGKVTKTACHLGAIWWGVYHNTNYRSPISLDFPEMEKLVPIPCGCHLVPDNEGQIRSILIHLSDEHDGRSGWTDAKVAEWLEASLTS